MLAIGVLGLNFKTADLALREAIARGVQSLSDQRAIFFPHPTVVLSTCNRTEVYFSASDLAAAHSDLLAHLRTQISEPFELRLYSYFGIDCFAHLCRVTAGLDSAIFAETEIQRQVKIAYSRASGFHRLPSDLHYLFQKALKVGKSVRTNLGQGPQTLYGTLWQMAEWTGKNILLVGNSEINRGFASYLIHKGISTFSLCTRYPETVRLEGVFVCDRSVLKQWQSFDVIVSASFAEEYLITGVGERRHLLFDLSVPRNIDSEVGLSATLYNIDQLMPNCRDVQGLGHCESLIWEQVFRLSQIYRIKTQHVPEIAEMGSHL